jgi:hypothetical protein
MLKALQGKTGIYLSNLACASFVFYLKILGIPAAGN